MTESFMGGGGVYDSSGWGVSMPHYLLYICTIKLSSLNSRPTTLLKNVNNKLQKVQFANNVDNDRIIVCVWVGRGRRGGWDYNS